MVFFFGAVYSRRVVCLHRSREPLHIGAPETDLQSGLQTQAKGPMGRS